MVSHPPLALYVCVCVYVLWEISFKENMQVTIINCICFILDINFYGWIYEFQTYFYQSTGQKSSLRYSNRKTCHLYFNKIQKIWLSIKWLTVLDFWNKDHVILYSQHVQTGQTYGLLLTYIELLRFLNFLICLNSLRNRKGLFLFWKNDFICVQIPKGPYQVNS